MIELSNRLFEGLSPALGRESHEFLDEVSFHSPDLNSGRGARSGRFQDSDDEDEDQSDSDKSGQASPRKKYASVQPVEDLGEDEDDVFLDEKRKPKSSKFSRLMKFILTISPKLPQKLLEFYNKHPKPTKWSLFALASLVPLFLIAFIVLVIITEAGYRSPTVYPTNLLATSAPEAEIWGFNFTRAVNLTIINTSKMTIDYETIDIDVNLARVPANFKVLSL